MRYAVKNSDGETVYEYTNMDDAELFAEGANHATGFSVYYVEKVEGDTEWMVRVGHGFVPCLALSVQNKGGDLVTVAGWGGEPDPEDELFAGLDDDDEQPDPDGDD